MRRAAWGFAATIAVCAVGAQAAVAGTATGKVEIEGALATNHPTPRAGDEIYLYLNATPLEAAAELTLEVVLPDAVRTLHDAQVQAVFATVAADQTVTLAVPVRVDTEEPREIVGTATLESTDRMRRSRSFVLTLNPAPPPADTGRPGRNREGESLIIYPSGQ